MRNLANPPEAVKSVLTAVFYFYTDDKDSSWNNLKKKMLGDMKLLDRLKDFNVFKIEPVQSVRFKKLYKNLVQEFGCDGD